MLAEMRFSQRKGLTPVRLEVQKDSMDAALRNKLWSALWLLVFNADLVDFFHSNEDHEAIRDRLWLHFFERPIDQRPPRGLKGLSDYARAWFMEAKWFEIYDFLERVAGELKGAHLERFTNLVNAFLQDGQSAYRLLGASIVDITAEEELTAIVDAQTDSHPLVGVRTHIENAVAKLADRSNPDYRNSIKESIMAVEAMCQALTGDPNVTLGKALKRLKDNGIDLHPALEHAWSKLYGFTNDASGIRHALSNEPTVTAADAKYMLVSCSSFVSYLAAQAASANIPLRAPS
jgi:hypothetical protein